MVRHPFPQGSCNGHVLLVAFSLANSKALTMRPVIEVSSVFLVVVAAASFGNVRRGPIV